MNDLPQLASLLKSRNTIDSKIARLIGHASDAQSVGEFIASAIFGIVLDRPAMHRNSDGHFLRGPLVGKSVDVQWRIRHDGILHLRTDPLPDYYLAFVGLKELTDLHTLTVPWLIESVYLFHAGELFNALRERGVQVGTGTSVTGPLWERAEIYPMQRNSALLLSQEQRAMLALFR
jgi:hypothetical protein